MNGYARTTKEDEFFLLTHYISRRVAYPIALCCRRFGVPANAVTILGGMCWIVSIVTLPLAGYFIQHGMVRQGWWMIAASLLLWNAGYILDVADGSLARLTNSTSSAGYFLDFVFHLIFNPIFLASVGLFLYLVTEHFFYVPVALISITCNWGLSFAGKEHVLCEKVAKGDLDVDSMSDDQRYATFIDSPKTRAPLNQKSSRALSLVRSLIEELICFPGQFGLFSLIFLSDLVLRKWTGDTFYITRCAFIGVTALMTLRVPFRIHREYRTMERLDLTTVRHGTTEGTDA